MNLLISTILVSIVWLASGLALTSEISEKGLDFKNYDKEDWKDFVIDLMIGFPIYIRFLIMYTVKTISMLWKLLK